MNQESFTGGSETTWEELSGQECKKAARGLLASFDEALLSNSEFKIESAKHFLGQRDSEDSNAVSFVTQSGGYVVYREQRELLGGSFDGIAIFYKGKIDGGKSETIQAKVSLNGYYSGEIYYDRTEQDRRGDSSPMEYRRNTQVAIDKINKVIAQLANPTE